MNECLQAWLRAVTGAQARGYVRMSGSSSTTLWRVEVGGERLVLRVHDNSDWLRAEPDLVLHEVAALQLACDAGLPAPEPVAWDAEGAFCGLPLLLMSWLPGKVLLRPASMDDWLRQQAQALVDIHRLTAHDLTWDWFSWAQPDLEVPAWSEVPQAWERAIAFIAGEPPPAPRCLVHRDYHPVNLLWRGQTLSAVVDWVNACRGVAAVDLAHCRGNLIALYGPEAADRFLQHYRRAGGADHGDMAWWDLMCLAECLPGPPEVYPGWVPFGVRNITREMLCARLEAHLLAVLRQLPE